MLILDGAYGEGGGQILRTALLCSLLTDQPFRIENIRRGRTQPGLKPQHLHIIQALLQMSDARAEGVEPGAFTLTFHPGALRGGVYTFEIGTAGAIPLFLQTLLPAAFFADKPLRFTVGGGTDVRGAMTIDFWQQVLLPFIRPYAGQVELQVQQRGFYPNGGGRVQVVVTPRFGQRTWMNGQATISPLLLDERGDLQGVQIYSVASTHLRERKVATRQASACYNRLRSQPKQSHISHVAAYSPGSAITAVAEYEYTRLGVSGVGERGKSSEAVGEEAAEQLTLELATSATVDVHTADNLMVWVALFGGRYTFAKATGHIVTNAWTIEQFLPGALKLSENQLTDKSNKHRILS